jgi:hypothetical protein
MEFVTGFPSAHDFFSVVVSRFEGFNFRFDKPVPITTLSVSFLFVFRFSRSGFRASW